MLQAEVITVLNTWKSIASFILTGIKDVDKKELVGDIIEPRMGSIMKSPLERLFSSFSPGKENN